MHYTKVMLKLLFLKNSRLEKNFGYDDDETIKHLERNMEQLKKAKLDYPGPPPDNELPQKPFGMLFLFQLNKKPIKIHSCMSCFCFLEKSRLLQQVIKIKETY